MFIETPLKSVNSSSMSPGLMRSAVRRSVDSENRGRSDGEASPMLLGLRERSTTYRAEGPDGELPRALSLERCPDPSAP